jgi:hypothetical protein
VVFQLGQVEIRAASPLHQAAGIVKEVQPEIEETAGQGRPVDHDVAFIQVPSPGPGQQGRDRGVEPVGLAVRSGELDGAVDRVPQIELAFQEVGPGRCGGVLEVRHEDIGAGIESINDHLAIGGTGDLHPAILEVGRRRRDPPVTFPDVARLRQEAGNLSPIEPGLADPALLQQLQSPGVESPLEEGQEIDGAGSQNGVVSRPHRTPNFYPAGRHVGSGRYSGWMITRPGPARHEPRIGWH